MKRLFILLALIGLISSTKAQNIGIGQWQDELPYSKVIKIENAGNVIYGATPYSLFTFDKATAIMKRYSKVNGLSDVGISNIAFSQHSKTLMIAYTNTNIDLVRENGTIVNMPDIKRKQILGKKTINDIYFIEDKAYLSCGFGIVVINVNKAEVEDTWYIGDNATSVEVHDLDVLGDSIYAVTEKGIKVGHLMADNLADFNNWQAVQNIPHNTGVFTNIIQHNNKLIVSYHPESREDKIYVYENKAWHLLPNPIPEKVPVKNFASTNTDFFIINEYLIQKYTADLQFDRKVYTYGNGFYGMNPTSLFQDKDNQYWISDGNYGLLRTTNLWNFQSYQLNGPYNALVYDMDAKGSRLVVTPGGRKESTTNNWNNDGIFTKSNDTWYHYWRRNTPDLDGFYDFVGVSVNPVNTNQYAAGSWNEGVVIFDENGFVAGYDESNSPLPSITSQNYVRVGDVEYDQAGNLWVNCAGTSNLMNRLSPDGNWDTWNLGSIAAKDIGDMSIDSRGYKWMRLRQGSSFYAFVFDEKQPQGNQLKGINGATGQGNITGSQVWCMTEDLDGEMWIGTDEGVCVMYNPSNIFNGGNFDAQTILVEHEDGYVRPLLKSEQVNEIAVDGANRKWIATEKSGVFLVSEDGLEEIHHFTEDNSPLYSNIVKTIAIADDGTVYMGTTKGIIAYKGEAAKPEETYTDVYTYPNPVRPEYHGPIAIKGLIRDASVKITSVYGHLVSEMKSYGGQAVWDGKDLQGQRVQTGVYLVFVTNDDGSDTMVTKILFVN